MLNEINSMCPVVHEYTPDAEDDDIEDFLSELDRRCSLTSRKSSGDDGLLSPVPQIHIPPRSTSPCTMLSPISAGVELECNAFADRPVSPSRSKLTPPCSPLFKVPRDAKQPSRGSICSLSSDRNESGTESEEDDTFCADPVQRPRSGTCPDIKALRKRQLLKLNPRPPTPPVKHVALNDGLNRGDGQDIDRQ